MSQAAPTVVTYPIGGGGRSVHSESRFSEIRATPSTPYIVPISTGGSSHKTSSYRESHSSQAAAPTIVYSAPAPSSSFSSERYSSSSSAGAAPAIIPVIPSGGSSRYSHHESFSNQGSGGLVAPVVSYPAGSSAISSRFSESSSSLGGNGLGAAIVSYPSGGGSSASHYESSSSNGGFGNNLVTYHPSSHHRQISQRFGEDIGSFGSTNLGHYMSESERLARLQAQNIQGQSGYKAASTVDFGNANLIAEPSAGSRTKSWEKSSKWSSQSEVSCVRKNELTF